MPRHAGRCRLWKALDALDEANELYWEASRESRDAETMQYLYERCNVAYYRAQALRKQLDSADGPFLKIRTDVPSPMAAA